MPPRLTPLEVSLLAVDTARTPAHTGTVDVFACGPGGFDYEALIGLIRERIAYVPATASGYATSRLGWPARSGWTTTSST